MKIILQEELNDSIELFKLATKEIKRLVGSSINVEIQHKYKDNPVPSIDKLLINVANLLMPQPGYKIMVEDAKDSILIEKNFSISEVVRATLEILKLKL
jgi:hypothetical protein